MIRTVLINCNQLIEEKENISSLCFMLWKQAVENSSKYIVAIYDKFKIKQKQSR